MSLTDRNAAIRVLRRTVRDESADPMVRLDAAQKLIEGYGATERNSATLRRRIKQMMLSADPVIAARACEIRDLLVLKLEKKPANRVIKSLMNITGDDNDVQCARSKPSRGPFHSRRLVIPQPPADGYTVGDCPLQPYIERLKAAAGTLRLCAWTARLRVALGIGESEPIDWELVSKMWLACFHEDEMDGLSALSTAITGYAATHNLALPRPTVSIMRELERR